METGVLSTELTYLAWSVVLLVVHIVVQALFLTKDGGLAHTVGARDGDAPLSVVTDRLTRALRNFLETYGAFIALALALQVTGKTGGIGAIGAALWFWARVVYVPAYALGIPYLRSLVWGVALVGLLMMLFRLLG
ncbi:MAG: MAPEG family protein [Rhizobiaceae bacterium]|nr:MAPEG family protein [Rhizobiaceae bacterium]